MKRLLLLLLIVVPALSFSTTDDVMYVYKNDGSIEVVFFNSLDSIAFSELDADSVRQSNVVTQEFWLADSVLRIPLASIDSVSFVTPETVFKEGVKDVSSSLWDYVVSVDSLTITFRSDLPLMLQPSVGDKLVVMEWSDLFPHGFMGIVDHIADSANGIEVICTEVDPEEVFERYYYTGSFVVAEQPSEVRGRRRIIHDGGETFDFDPIVFTKTWKNSFHISDDVAVYAGDETIYSLTPTFDVNVSYIVGEGIGKHFYTTIIGTFDIEQSHNMLFGITGELSESFFGLNVPKFYLFDSPLAFYMDAGLFIRGTGEGAFGTTLKDSYRWTCMFRYDSTSDDNAPPSNKLTHVTSERQANKLIGRASLELGVYSEIGFLFLHEKLCKFCLRREFGLFAELSATILQEEALKAKEDTQLYDKLAANRKAYTMGFYKGTSVDVKVWRFNWTETLTLKREHPFWEGGFVPLFSDVSATRDNLSGDIAASASMEGDVIFDTNIGFEAKDESGNTVASVVDEHNYRSNQSYPSCELIMENAENAAVVYPTVTFLGVTMLASPQTQITEKNYAFMSVDPYILECEDASVGKNSKSTFTITNMGDIDLVYTILCSENSKPFAVSEGEIELTLAPRESRIHTVTFSPTEAHYFSQEVIIESNAINREETKVYLHGTGLQPSSPVISINPETVTFEETVAGGSSISSFVVTNTGDAPLEFSVSCGPNDKPFSMVEGKKDVVLQPNESHPFEVMFTPSQSGTFTKSFSVISNAVEGPRSITFNGVCRELKTLEIDETHLQFSAVSTYRSLNLTGTDSWTAAVTEGSDWLTVSPLKGTGSGTLSINAATNTTTITRSGVIVVTPSEVAPISIEVTQQGATPGFKLNTDKIDFGNVKVGDEKSITFSIVCTEGVEIDITGLSVEDHPDFSLSWAGGIVTPNQVQFVTLTFAPSSATKQSFSFMLFDKKRTGTNQIIQLSVAGNGYFEAPAIDLGLPSGVLWAAWNLGASTPSESGSYFAWGEVEQKERCSWSSYKWCEGSSTTLTKYNLFAKYGDVDGKLILEKADDAASVNWGDSWRMPTDKEFEELKAYCSYEWTTKNGISGYQLTSKVPGFTDQSIFLPTAGYFSSSVQHPEIGYYWLASVEEENTQYADCISLDEETFFLNNNYRWAGFTIRPVCEAPSAPIKVSQNSLDFGGVKIGETRTLTFTVSTTEGQDVDVVVEKNSGNDFTVSWTGGVIESNSTRFVQVTFTPSTPGNQTGTIVLKNRNAAERERSVVVNISGSGEKLAEKIDLGLPSGLLWASWNIGASAPEEYGDLISWGELGAKEVYSWDSYKWGTRYALTKYVNSSDFGTVDNITSLEASDDAARMRWGDGWRMPTMGELLELRSNTTFSWTTMNGITVCKLTSKNNGKTLVLPAAGVYAGKLQYRGSDVYLASTDLYEGRCTDRLVLNIASGDSDWSYLYIFRYYGISVRPVCEP